MGTPATRRSPAAMGAPCMHPSGLAAASQTTASWVAELSPAGSSHWVTAHRRPLHRACSSRSRSPSRSTSGRRRSTASTTGACGGVTNCCTAPRSPIPSGWSPGSRASGTRSRNALAGGTARAGRRLRRGDRLLRPWTDLVRQGETPRSSPSLGAALLAPPGSAGRLPDHRPPPDRSSHVTTSADRRAAPPSSLPIDTSTPAVPVAVGDHRRVRRPRQPRQGGGLRRRSDSTSSWASGTVRDSRTSSTGVGCSTATATVGVFNLGHRNPVIVAGRPRGPRPPRHRQPPPRLGLAGAAGRAAGGDRPRGLLPGVVFGVGGGEANDLAAQGGPGPHGARRRRVGGRRLPRAHRAVDGGRRPRVPRPVRAEPARLRPGAVQRPRPRSTRRSTTRPQP